MIAGDNYVIFKTDTIFEDKVKLQNKTFYFDPGFEPTRHTRIYGEVVQIPLRLRRVPIMQMKKGIPEYHDDPPFEYKYASDIPMDVRVGDRIYFHFNIMMKINQQLVKEEKGENGKPVYYVRVRYESILCAIRNGEIIPVGSYTLIEPDMESLEEILIPIAQVGADGKAMRYADGTPIMKPKDQWLQKKVAPSAKPLRGWVRHVGSPLIGDVCEVKVGQLVYFRPNSDWTVPIEGKDYFLIRQRHLLGRIED